MRANRALESAVTAYESGSAARPTPILAAGPSDADRAAEVVAEETAMIDHADLALAHASEGRVLDFARVVHERMSEAKLRLALVAIVPDVPPPTDRLVGLAWDSPTDFDREYVATQLEGTLGLLRTLAAIIPATNDVTLRRRLMDLRPVLDDLLTRSFELQQILR
jgi:predicted outer membrane protein